MGTTGSNNARNAGAHSVFSLASVAQPVEMLLLADAKASLAERWCGDDGKFLLPPSQPDGHCWGRPTPLHSGAVTCSG